jgi:hypothetical protein
MKFKKISQSKRACFYALVEDVDSIEYKKLIDWLNAHCPDAYEIDNMHLIIERRAEVFFELTFDLN